MTVIFVYVALVLAGEVVAYFIAQAFDVVVPVAWSMIFYMSLFFGVIYGMWPVAVRITEKYLMGESEAPAGQARRT
jgi:hypothetical protein